MQFKYQNLKTFILKEERAAELIKYIDKVCQKWKINFFDLFHLFSKLIIIIRKIGAHIYKIFLKDPNHFYKYLGSFCNQKNLFFLNQLKSAYINKKKSSQIYMKDLFINQLMADNLLQIFGFYLAADFSLAQLTKIVSKSLNSQILLSFESQTKDLDIEKIIHYKIVQSISLLNPQKRNKIIECLNIQFHQNKIGYLQRLGRKAMLSRIQKKFIFQLKVKKIKIIENILKKWLQQNNGSEKLCFQLQKWYRICTQSNSLQTTRYLSCYAYILKTLFSITYCLPIQMLYVFSLIISKFIRAGLFYSEHCNSFIVLTFIRNNLQQILKILNNCSGGVQILYSLVAFMLLLYQNEEMDKQLNICYQLIEILIVQLKDSLPSFLHIFNKSISCFQIITPKQIQIQFDEVLKMIISQKLQQEKIFLLINYIQQHILKTYFQHPFLNQQKKGLLFYHITKLFSAEWTIAPSAIYSTLIKLIFKCLSVLNSFRCQQIKLQPFDQSFTPQLLLQYIEQQIHINKQKCFYAINAIVYGYNLLKKIKTQGFPDQTYEEFRNKLTKRVVINQNDFFLPYWLICLCIQGKIDIKWLQALQVGLQLLPNVEFCHKLVPLLFLQILSKNKELIQAIVKKFIQVLNSQQRVYKQIFLKSFQIMKEWQKSSRISLQFKCAMCDMKKKIPEIQIARAYEEIDKTTYAIYYYQLYFSKMQYLPVDPTLKQKIYHLYMYLTQQLQQNTNHLTLTNTQQFFKYSSIFKEQYFIQLINKLNDKSQMNKYELEQFEISTQKYARDKYLEIGKKLTVIQGFRQKKNLIVEAIILVDFNLIIQILLFAKKNKLLKRNLNKIDLKSQLSKNSLSKLTQLSQKQIQGHTSFLQVLQDKTIPFIINKIKKFPIQFEVRSKYLRVLQKIIDVLFNENRQFCKLYNKFEFLLSKFYLQNKKYSQCQQCLNKIEDISFLQSQFYLIKSKLLWKKFRMIQSIKLLEDNFQKSQHKQLYLKNIITRKAKTQKYKLQKICQQAQNLIQKQNLHSQSLHYCLAHILDQNIYSWYPFAKPINWQMIIKQYINSIIIGQGKAFSRLLRIYFDGIQYQKHQVIKDFLSLIHKVHQSMFQFIMKVQPIKIYKIIQDLIIRYDHKEEAVRNFVKKGLVRVVINFTQQSVWWLFPLMYGDFTNDNKKSKQFFHSKKFLFANEILNDMKMQYQQKFNYYKECEQYLFQLLRFVFDASSRKVPKSILKIPKKLLCPLQQTLCVNSKPLYLHQLQQKVIILPSKQKPKKLIFKCFDEKGKYKKQVTFLLKKMEKDVRKQSRVADFVNFLSTKKQFQILIKHKVIALCKIVSMHEWIQNTNTVRNHVQQLWKKNNMKISLQHRRIYTSQNKFFKNQIQIQFKKPNVFQQLFFEVGPQKWWQFSHNYIKSTACWSYIGYIIGLGDRHCDNILFLNSTGQIHHIDYSLIFDQGLQLPVPQIVVFRLTKNIQAPMGVLKSEGLFRSNLLKLAKFGKKLKMQIMSQLDSFIHDPVVSYQNPKKIIKKIQTKINFIKFKSIQEGVDFLIQSSKDQLSLAQMYYGWLPYL